MCHRNFLLASLALALLGFWMPWLTHPAAALRLNGFELSEWVTFLPGVRDGSLPFGRLTFLIPLAALIPLFGIAAARSRGAAPPARRRFRLLALLPTSPLGWGLLLLALLCAAAVFPPYEAFVRADYWPEYRPQFFAACAALVVLGVIFTLPDEANHVLQILFALLGGGFAFWAALSVRAVALQEFHTGWSLGLGWAAIVGGFAGLCLSGWARLFGPR